MRGGSLPMKQSTAEALPAGDPQLSTEALERLKIERMDRESPAIDLRSIWATLYRSRLAIAAIVGACVMLGVLATALMPRLYQARASIQIDQQVTKVLGTEDAEPQVIGSDADRFLQTQVDLLRSRTSARRVAESLNLAANDEFLERMNGGEIDADPTGPSRLDRVLDALQENLAVDLPRSTQIVSIFFTSRDRELAADIANSYSRSFIESNIERKFSTSAYSRSFLQNQLGLAKSRLEQSERDLIAYARSAGLIDARAGADASVAVDGPRSLVAANLVQLNAELAELDARRVSAQQHWEQSRASPLLSLPEVLGNDAIQRLSQKRAEELADLAELRIRLKPDHPTVLQATSQVEALDQQIEALASSIRQSIRTDYLTAARQHGALARTVDRLKGATLAEQDRSVRYNILQREVDTNRQLYESLLQRYKELSAEAGVTSNNISIVDTAEPPQRPTSPKPLLNMALALLAGIALALLYAFGRDYLHDVIRDPQDIEKRLHIPLLGVVPAHGDGNVLQGLDSPKSEIAEAYHSVRTSIELSSNQGVPSSILVTGTGASEGKSTSAYALARDFAGLGRNVLLVDADLRRPSLHRVLQMTRTAQGLSSVLAQMAAPAAAIQPTAIANLSAMPSGPLPPDPATLFAGTALEELLAELAQEYDVVVLDGPPVFGLADATQLSAAAAATVFVVEAGSSRFGQARNALRRLFRAGGNVVGCLVTKYDARQAGYGVGTDYYTYRYSADEA